MTQKIKPVEQLYYMETGLDEKSVLILISWLLEKPADLDLHCFQRVYRNLVTCTLCLLLVFVFNIPPIKTRPQPISSYRLVKPEIKPTIPGLQGEWFIHYTTSATLFNMFNGPVYIVYENGMYS